VSLDGFYTERRCCGDLNAGVDGDIVWMACDCGARIARRVIKEEAMTVFGWLLILGGGAWAVLGAVNVWAAFQPAILAENEAARNAASQTTAVSVILNGLVFIFPGLLVAGIGALVAKRAGCVDAAGIEPESPELVEDRVPCPHCAEMILPAAKICLFCTRPVG
jgi:hypothetical protein